MFIPRPRPSLFLLLLLTLGWPGMAIAATTPTAENVAARIAELEKGASDPASQSLLQTYFRAQGFLEAQAAHVTAAAKFAKTVTQAPETVKEIKDEQAGFERRRDLPPLTTQEKRADIAELERLLGEASARRVEIENKLSGYELSDAEFRSRPAAIAEEKTQVSNRIAELEVALGKAQTAESAELARATQAVTEAELAAKQAELELLNQEQLSLGVRAEINTARRARATAELALVTARVDALEGVLAERRQHDLASVQASAAQAAREASGGDPANQRLAQANTALSEELSQLVDGQDLAARERTGYTEQRQRIAADFERARQRVDLAGTWSGLGRILVEQRRQLPLVRALTREAKRNEGRVSRIGIRRIEIDEALRHAEAQQAASPPPADDTVATQAAALRKDQVELLRNLEASYASYLRSLDATDFELQQLTTLVAAYSTYLDERLLWLRNAPPINAQFLPALTSTARSLFAVDAVAVLGRDVAAGARAGGLRVLGIAVVAALLMRNRRRLKQLLVDCAVPTRHVATDRMRYTLLALLVTTVLAIPWPLALLALAELLRSGYEASEPALMIAQIARYAAALAFAFLWVSELLGGEGVARVHLGWPEAAARPVRRAWLRLSHVFVFPYAAAVMLEWYGDPDIQYGLRRLLFLVSMGSLAMFAHWLMRRDSVLRAQTAARQPAAWYVRAWPALAAFALLPPLVLMVLSVFGYQYTAMELSRYYLETLLLLFLALLTYSLALRWLLVAQRRLVLRRAQAQAAALGPAGTPENEEALQSALDIATVSSQTRLVLRNVMGWSIAFGLFWVWRDVLPALTFFDNVTLWQIQVKAPTGELQTQPITIASLALAAIIGVITVMASRNVPGVLEITLLERLKLHHGSRYAATTLVQYVIVAFGVTFGLSTLGLRWSQIQWLIAALGVGLGFGLQEIFANFISGLILLFERPIRVGDLVTIGDRTGSVQRIDIRATRIRDADDREIIVPNKAFITERFINWTLDDTMTRVVITLGVAFESDPTTVQRLLTEIANSHPVVLKEPAPQVLFHSFSGKALNFEVAVFVAELAHRSTVAHDLNTRIQRAFAKHGIGPP